MEKVSDAGLGFVVSRLRMAGDRLIFAYLGVLFLVLAVGIVGQPWANDETAYYLMADSFARTNSFEVYNGLDEGFAPQLRLHGMRLVESGGRAALVGIPSPLYPLMAFPFYASMGAWGLALMNLAAFILTTYLVYALSLKVFKEWEPALTAAVVYSAFTYSIRYSVEIWPHSLSVLFTFLPAVAVATRKSWGVLFLAGLSSGLAVGVRYPDILFTAVLAAYLFSRKEWRGLVSFLAGAAAPLAVIGYLNFGIYGSPLTTGYGGAIEMSTYSYQASTLIVGFLVFFCIAYRERIIGTIRGSTRWRAAAFAGVLAALVLFAIFPQYLFTPARLIYSELVDFSANPRYDELPLKRALLQASPILILSVLGLLMARDALDAGLARLLVALPLIEVLFYGGTVGGDGSINLMRYLLEAVPYASVFAGYFMWRFLAGLKPGDYSLLWLSYILVAFLLVESINMFPQGAATYVTFKLPIILSAAVISLYSLRERGGCGRLFRYAVASAAIASLVFNFTTTMETVKTRNYLAQVVGELDRRVGDDSAVFYSGYLDQVPFTTLKDHKRVRIANIQAADLASNKALADRYLRGNVSVYFVRTIGEDEAPGMEELTAAYTAEWAKGYDADRALVKVRKPAM
jgi:hypothetical protein